jgi:crossover junction endodeoxyribonuclease RuvC
VQAPNLTEDEATELAIDCGGEDVQLGDECWEILTAPEDLAQVAKAVEAKKLVVSEAEFVRIPKTPTMVSDDDAPRCRSSWTSWTTTTTCRACTATWNSRKRPWPRWNSASKRILGIDPGSLHCGYALLEDLGGRFPLVREAGVWHLGDKTALPKRLADLQQRLENLLTSHCPTQLALEESFVHKNIHSAMVLGHARGVILATCARREMEIFEYAPSSIKQTVAGSGRASKEGVADMVRRQLALQELPASADATDRALRWRSRLQDRRQPAAKSRASTWKPT